MQLRNSLATEAPLSIGQCATLACLLEASSPKPGNVHRGSDFEDMTFTDFAVSAAAIAPAMDSAVQQGVGAAVLAAVQATRRLVPVNTNLGTVLLLAPLAAVPRPQRLKAGIHDVLRSLTSRDAEAVYAAIRLAEPGGLGSADQMDVAEAAPKACWRRWPRLPTAIWWRGSMPKTSSTSWTMSSPGLSKGTRPDGR